jgi:hypothetical protein
MLKGIGKILKAGLAVGKPFAVAAVKRVTVEAAENVIPGGDLGMDIGRAVLGKFFGGDETLADRLQHLSDDEAAQLAELLTDVLALSEVANGARADGELSADEIEAVFESIDELGQQAGGLLNIEH